MGKKLVKSISEMNTSVKSIVVVLGVSGAPYCNQSMMGSHHNFMHNQPGSEHMGSGDGETTNSVTINPSVDFNMIRPD